MTDSKGLRLHHLRQTDLLRIESKGLFLLPRIFSVRTHVKFTSVNEIESLGNLSKDVFERRTSTGSEAY